MVALPVTSAIQKLTQAGSRSEAIWETQGDPGSKQIKAESIWQVFKWRAGFKNSSSNMTSL